MQLIFAGIGVAIIAIICFVVWFNENYEDEDEDRTRRDWQMH